jgi:hypothetical protein
MTNTNNTLSTLRQELEFLDHGGYRTPIQYRQPLFCMETSVESRKPLFFEESPACPKKRHTACRPESGCALMGFVPVEHQHETVPCRHIPLNEKGETIDSLYRTGANEKVERTLRSWLVKTIQQFEPPIPIEPLSRKDVNLSHEKAAVPPPSRVAES